MTNAVTRSGTNDFAGRARRLQPESFVAQKKGRDRQGEARPLDPAASLSGPLVRDKVWWYASGRWYRSTLGDRTNNTGPIPDEKTTTDEYFGKITARPDEPAP